MKGILTMNDDEYMAAQAIETEASAVRSAKAGQRNEALASAAFSLGTLGAQGLLTRYRAYKALEEAALSAGLDLQEISATFSAAWGSAQTAVSPPADKDADYLADAARVLFEIEEAIDRQAGRAYPKNDPDGSKYRDRINRLSAVAEEYKQLGALQRGITPWIC